MYATLCALERSSFVEVVESVVEAVKSVVVKAVDCCRLLSKQLNLLLKLFYLLVLKLFIVVGYYVLQFY